MNLHDTTDRCERYRRFFTKEYLMGPNSFRLLDELLRRAPADARFDRTLDLGCGFGVMGICLAATEKVEMVMSDVNRRALDLARENAEKNHVQAEIVESDGLSALNGSFCQIITNPPIRTGKQVIYALFAQCRDHLTPDGKLYLVIRKQQGADSAKAYLATLFENVETIARKKGFYIFCCSGPLPAGA